MHQLVEFTNGVFKAIHQCIMHSTIRHLLIIPKSILIEYLATQPYFRGTDTIYYILLKKYGSDVHYDSFGRHLISIQPELSGVYILAEQDMNAPVNKDFKEPTIYSILEKTIYRTFECERYRLRNSIITEDADISVAVKIPSISLNFPKYQRAYENAILNKDVLKLLIDYDYWDPISSLDYSTLIMMTDRMSYIASVAPELWKYFHRHYYTSNLISLQLHKFLPHLASRQLFCLNSLIPDIIKLPKLDSIGIRLWYTDPISRAYLLGFDIIQGAPNEQIILGKLQQLQQLGIESYLDTITGVFLDNNNNLTGKIGDQFFPQLQGKKLLNSRTSLNTPIGMHYVSDLVPIYNNETVEILLIHDFYKAITSDVIDIHLIIDLISSGTFSKLSPLITEEIAGEILDRISTTTSVKRCIPAREHLVDIMLYDIIY